MNWKIVNFVNANFEESHIDRNKIKFAVGKLKTEVTEPRRGFGEMNSLHYVNI